ncbi:Bardet-Biedl syndrome 1 [Rhipicephalus microplus]|uniref:Bardet-Biedl syndrome 1 n=1 Tax=Rhipicephalus microplus TaxID=6941 RepID=UPI003F6A93BB
MRRRRAVGPPSGGPPGGAWLRAHHDPYASLYALPGGLCTADVLADGDQRLLVADLRNGGRLRLFRGGRQQQQAEQALAALPCGLAAFRTGRYGFVFVLFCFVLPDHSGTYPQYNIRSHEIQSGSIKHHVDVPLSCNAARARQQSSAARAESAPAGQPPSVAVAAGSCLYVYRNLRPFYKFSLPHTAADEQENEAWSKHQDPDALRETLEALRSQGGMGRLTARSQRFLLLEPEEATAFIEANWEFPLKRQTQVTALGVLKKSLADEDAATCLLLATEDGRLFVLEPDAFTLLAAVQASTHCGADYVGCAEPRKAQKAFGKKKKKRGGGLEVYCSYLGEKECAFRFEVVLGKCMRYHVSFCLLVFVGTLRIRRFVCAVQVPGAVCCLDAQGAFDVDFHVALATRDDRLHVVKRGHKASRVLAEPGAPAVGLCHLEPGQLVAACADRRLRAYSLKGQCVWSVSLGAQPLAVAAVCRPGVCQAAAVALADRRVVLHSAADGAPTHVLNTRDAVSAIHFGRLGREDNALVMVGTGGSLTVLILRRNAQLLQSPSSRETPGGNAVGGPRWSLPKKTKLFVDQTMREREHSVAMHRGFLRDLQRLRLTAARHYHRAVLGAAAPARASTDGDDTGPVLVEVTAQVQGLGPRLAVHVRLQSSRPLNRLTMVVHGDDQYRLQKPATQVAYLVPGLAYRYTAMVTAESGAPGVLKVVVAKQTKVLATALVQMPALDMP